MATTIFTSQTPVITDADDGTDYTLGTTFYSDDAVSAVGIRWFFPLTLPTGTTSVRLYDYVTQALLGSADFVAPVAGQWNTATFASPVALAADTPYIAAVYTSGRYVATANFFSAAGVDNEQLHAPQDNTDPLGTGALRNGRLSNVDSYPSINSGNQASYFPDIVLADSTVTGVLDATAPAAVAALAGTASADGVLTATAPAAVAALAGTATADGVLSATAPAAVAALAGTASADGVLTATAPAAVAALTGTAAADGTLTATAPAAVAALAGSSTAGGVLTATAPAAVAALAGTADADGILTATAPAAVAALTGIVDITGVLTATAPAAVAALTGISEVQTLPVLGGSVTVLGLGGAVTVLGLGGTVEII